MRIVGLIFGALLASTSIAAAQNCPSTFASCPPVSTAQINLGGPIVNQQGVPFVPPVAMPSASGQVLTTNGDGTTRWSNAGGGIAAPGTTTPNFVPFWNSTTGAALANGLPTAAAGASVLLQTNGNGQIDPSTVPIATTNALGGLKPDGTTITVNPTTGVASAIGGAATSVVVGTTTVGSGTPGSLLVNTSGLVGNVVALPAANEPAHTGDATNTAGSLALTLATVNSGPGSIGSASLIPILTTDGKGRVISQSTTAVIAPAGTLTGSALPAGVTGSSLTSLGTLTGLNVSGTANTAGVVDTLPATALAYGLNTTAGLKLGGTICAPGLNGCVLDNEITYTENTTAAVRMRYWFDTVVHNATTSGFDEQFFVGKNITSPAGTGIITSEQNNIHGLMQVATGVTITAANLENFEGSTSNSGAVSHFNNYLALQGNNAGGTISQGTGVTSQFTNANTTAGAIGEFDGFLFTGCAAGTSGVCGGGGSVPTNYFAFRNNESAATVMTAGNVVIGGVAQAAKSQMLRIISTVPSGFSSGNTNPLIITGTIGNILVAYDDGHATLAGNLTLGISSGGNPQLGKVFMTNAVAGSSVIGLSPPSTGVLTSANLIMPDVSGTLALVNVAQSWSGTQTMAGSSSSFATFNIPQGTAPSAPNNGDIWTTASGLFVQIAGSTVGPLGSGSGGGITSVTAADTSLNINTTAGAVTAASNQAFSNNWSTLQQVTSAGSAGTAMFAVKSNGGSINALVARDDGTMALRSAISVGTSGVIGGGVSIINFAGGSVKLIDATGSTQTAAISFNPAGANDTVALLNTTNAFTGLNTFSGTANFTGTLSGAGVAGVTCATGAPTASFSVSNGIVTHC